MRTKFLEKLKESMIKKLSNAKLMSHEKYNEVVQRLKDLNENDSAKTNKDYRLLNRYNLLKISVDNISVWKLKKKDTDKTIVHADEIFDIINSSHLATGHGGRDIVCLLYTSPSPRDGLLSRMPSSA